MKNFLKIAPMLTAVFALLLPGRADEPAPTLVWDAERKELDAKAGETVAYFFFQATNASADEIVVSDVRPTCGCSLVSMPAKPWKLAPGDSGRLEAKIDLVGKHGVLTKKLIVTSSVGVKDLVFQVNIPNLVGVPAVAKPGSALVPMLLPGSSSSPASGRLESLRRMRNQQTAAGDRQAVFRNDCAACHVAPTVGKMGGELFDTACGICHTAENRASMVPLLANIPSKEYWMHWITQGKEGSLMPVFSKSAGGPLTDDQIESLVNYLTSLPSPPTRPSQTPSAKGDLPEAVLTSAPTGSLLPKAAVSGEARSTVEGVPAPYRETRDQAGHEFVKTEQFVVPVGTTVVIEGLEFESGTSTLTPMQERIVQQIFNSLEEITENTVGDTDEARVKEHKKMVFEIRGYSADTGDRERDVKFSEECAKAVLNHLTKLGTPPRHLKSKGFGSENPVAPHTTTAEGRMKNCRVEFVRMQ